MNIIKTPDKIVLDRIAIEKILREHIQKTTGRTSRANVCFTELPAVNGFSNFQLTIELTDDAPVKETVKEPSVEEILERINKQGEHKQPFPTSPWLDGRSPGVVPPPLSPWPWPTTDTHYIGPSAGRTYVVNAMAKAWDLS